MLFRVNGLGGEYTVAINQDADLFEVVYCDCDDSVYRGSEIRCKHICHVLLALGADQQDVCDPDFAPTQGELTELLSYAPMVTQDVQGEGESRRKSQGHHSKFYEYVYP